MNNKNIEEQYTLFFSSLVRLFLILMIGAFIFNTAVIAFDENKTAAATEAALNGGNISETVSGIAVITAVKLLSGSLIIAFTYLSFLFLKRKEYIYSVITILIVSIFTFSSLSALL